MDELAPDRPLRRGWTTGTCAAGAAKAAYIGWRTGEIPAVVDVLLPGGERPVFAVATGDARPDGATAGLVKDAGDDPDVTHGALVLATVAPAPAGSGVLFRAGEGVGTVTRPGLPLPVGEPAINPVPRQMIRTAIAEAVAAVGGSEDVTVTVAIPGGEALARRTLNGRLGIVGGLSVLGTTGIVIPFSCSAWIHSIHRGVDVARAMGLAHIAGATGTTSEAAVQRLHDLPETALIEMGDFVGGLLKYVRRNPVPRVTVAGGFAKMVKLGQGLLDLHSRAGAVDLAWLAERSREAGADDAFARFAASANTANEVLEAARAENLPVAEVVARHAHRTAAAALARPDCAIGIAVFDRSGGLVAATPPTPAA